MFPCFVNFVYSQMGADDQADRRGWSREDALVFLRLLAPFAPHLAEELWQEGSVHVQPWPEYDKELVKEDMVEFVVQVNGKLRATVQVQSAKFLPRRQAGKVQSEIEKMAREDKRVRKYLDGKKAKKVIFVPGRLINFVL